MRNAIRGILISGLCVAFLITPGKSLAEDSLILQESEEFRKKMADLTNSFIDSPIVLKEIKRLEEIYPDQSGLGKYQRSGHQFTTYIVSMAAGLSRTQSYKLAYYSQFPDDEKRFSATLAFIYIFNQDYREQIMAVLHSLHGGGHQSVLKRRVDLRDLIRDGIKNNNLEDYQIGLIIHAFADSYAHTTCHNGQLKAFDYTWGHLFHGTKPDIIVHDPENYKNFTCELYKALSLTASCSPGLDQLHGMIEKLKTSRNAELPEFEKYVKNYLGFEPAIYESNIKTWQNLVKKSQVVDTIELIESKTKD